MLIMGARWSRWEWLARVKGHNYFPSPKWQWPIRADSGSSSYMTVMPCHELIGDLALKANHKPHVVRMQKIHACYTKLTTHLFLLVLLFLHQPWHCTHGSLEWINSVIPRRTGMQLKSTEENYIIMKNTRMLSAIWLHCQRTWEHLFI